MRLRHACMRAHGGMVGNLDGQPSLQPHAGSCRVMLSGMVRTCRSCAAGVCGLQPRIMIRSRSSIGDVVAVMTLGRCGSLTPGTTILSSNLDGIGKSHYTSPGSGALISSKR